MLLTISTTHLPATDLGYLLAKNPARCQSFDLGFGKAHIAYPEATEERCTVALVLDVDPIGLVRRRGPAGEGRALEQYVNDRPYVASSFLSVAIAEVFGAALGGRCRDRPELARTPIALRATLAAVPCAGGEAMLRCLFEPLGWTVEARGAALDDAFPEWGASRYFAVTLTGTATLQQLLSHLYVLVPVLDGDKHYWVGDDEVEKLLRRGEGWLSTHPSREIITTRYLKHRRDLISDALSRLTAEELPPEAFTGEQGREEATLEAALEPASMFELLPAGEKDASAIAVKSQVGLSLNEQRLGAVFAALKASGASSVLDLGCGEGRLLQMLIADRQFSRITGMDVSHRALEIAADRLRYDQMPDFQKQRLTLMQGSLMYRDARLAGYDGAAVVEVIEHLDPPRREAFERVLFECARPSAVILTTPNRDYNVAWPTLPAGKFRHRDHRFEWSRAEFAVWCETTRARFGYRFRILPVGPENPSLGAPTQMAVFEIQ